MKSLRKKTDHELIQNFQDGNLHALGNTCAPSQG